MTDAPQGKLWEMNPVISGSFVSSSSLINEPGRPDITRPCQPDTSLHATLASSDPNTGDPHGHAENA